MGCIPMRTSCAPLLAELLLFYYENEFLDKLIEEGKRKLLESSISHIAILMSLSLSIMKDLRNSSPPVVSIHLSSFARPVVAQIIVTFYHATKSGDKTFVTGLQS